MKLTNPQRCCSCNKVTDRPWVDPEDGLIWCEGCVDFSAKPRYEWDELLGEGYYDE